MSFVSHAQNFEDVLLWRALRNVENGSYLDIGAQDPVQDSVSLAFYERGWRGIHVEPTPTYAAKLRDARPDETVIQAAVSASSGPIEFHEFADTGLSTGKADIAAMHEEQGFRVRKSLVPTVRLDDLLQRAGELHWLKIDVEGMEGEVLASWGTHPARPWVLVVEATTPLHQEQTDGLWRHHLVDRGYADVHFDGLSRFYLHESKEDLAAAFATPPNVFDGFQVTDQHFTSVLVRSRLRDLEAAAQAEQVAKVAAVERAELVGREWEARFREERERSGEALQALHGRFDEERRLLNDLLRNKIEESGRELRQAVEELATFRERSSNLSAQLERLERELDAAEQSRADELSAMRRQLEERAAELQQAQASDAAYQAQLAEMDLTVRKALAEPSGRWQRLGRALGLAREDGALRMLRSWPAHRVTSSIHLTESPMFFAPSGEARNPYLRANSLPELLSWYDVDFVRCAYVTVLGRQPDPAGEAYYLSRVRQGYSRTGILRQLRRSREARAHDPGIAGLDRALRKHHRANLPIVGHFARASGSYESDSPLERRLRALSNTLESGREREERRGASAAAAYADIAQKLDSLQELLRQGLALQSSSPRRIGQAEDAGEGTWCDALQDVLTSRDSKEA